MAELYPKSAEWLEQIHSYARAPYGESLAHAADVQNVIRGRFRVPKDLENSNVEIVRPSKAMNIVNKFLAMIAIRSEKGIIVAQKNLSAKEARVADKLERVLKAYLFEHQRGAQRDPFRDSAYYAITRGRAGLLTVYDPLKKGLRIRMRALDPFTYFPAYSDEGVEFFTMEYYRTRLELQAFWDKLERSNTSGQFTRPPTLDLPRAGTEALDMRDSLKVIEYWDERWHAYSIDGHFVRHEHGYGFVPLVEFRFNETPESEQRWAFASLISGVLEDLKLHAALMSKMATGVEQFYFPRLYYTTPDGSIAFIDHHTAPGDWERIKEGTRPIVLNPTANSEALRELLNIVENNIGQGSINPLVFSHDLPDVSGFLVSQYLSILQDDLADKRDPMQRAFGLSLGNVLRLMEQWAHEQDGGVWSLEVQPDGRRRPAVETISAEDIDGHYDVRVNLRVSLPQDKTIMLSQLGMGGKKDELTGMPEMDWQTRMEFSGIAQEVGDISTVRRRRELEWLISQDEEMRALYMDYIRAENDKVIQEWKREARKWRRREERRLEREEERNADMLVAQEEEMMSQMAGPTMARQAPGLPPELAMQLAQQFEVPQGATGFEDVLGFRAPTRFPFSGFEGLDPRVLPPQARGAMNRRTLDRERLRQEELDRLQDPRAVFRPGRGL